MQMQTALLLFVLLCAFVMSVDGQSKTPYFRAITERGGKWMAREKANVEFVKKTTDFKDGTRYNTPTVRLTNYFLLYGGTGDSSRTQPFNDVWASGDGVTWVFVAGCQGTDNPDECHPTNFASSYPPRAEAAHCQDSSYRQYRLGGHWRGELFGDVWMSVNGISWTPQTESGAFEPVYLANMVGDLNGNIYLAGGILELQGNPRRSTGAVYVSRNQGKVWTLVSTGYSLTTGQPTGPGERAVSILLNAQTNTLIWLTGVNTGYSTGDRFESYQKDVWASANQGKTFEPVNLNTPFGRRDDSNAEITDGGLLVLAGGYGGTGQGLENQGEIYNDVWVSPNGGYTWGLCVDNAEWDDRRYQMTLLDGDGYLWVMGGRSSGGEILQDMWKSTWTFSDVSTTATKCRVTVPSCGAGLKCLPTSGSTLVAADGSGVYCDACPYSFSGQNAVQTTVIAFLVVFVVLTVLAVIALIYTYHKLRSAGAPSPIPLPATAQRWWNKQTTGAVGSSDAGSTANGDGLYQPLRIRDQV